MNFPNNHFQKKHLKTALILFKQYQTQTSTEFLSDTFTSRETHNTNTNTSKSDDSFFTISRVIISLFLI
ncbi:hypothetical protein Glove_2g37 [Diversispora epigaea]|uniref:Uncharacterized protein n=1 Tax=Diversispora epigaea TaxID=1348612 RepID=A0A397JTD1_9GLOM|nr:hypothetical protein Glove_2g37 [Diversispora epigaea]